MKGLSPLSWGALLTTLGMDRESGRDTIQPSEPGTILSSGIIWVSILNISVGIGASRFRTRELEWTKILAFKSLSGNCQVIWG